jgi:urease accessory protein UreF
MLSSLDDLKQHCQDIIDQCFTFDFHFMASFFRDEELHEAWQHYHLQSRLPILREASLSQGRAWLRLAPTLFPDFDIKAFRQKLREADLPPHYLGVLCCILKHQHWDLERVMELYSFTLLRDQITSAIRLGLVGPSLGHGYLSDVLKHHQELPQAQHLHYQRAFRINPSLEIAQMHHTSLYSKQFKN